MGMSIKAQNQRFNSFFLIKYFLKIPYLPRFHVFFLLKLLTDLGNKTKQNNIYIIIADTASSKQFYLRHET